MKTNSSFHAAGEVATQPAWGTGEQAAQPLNGSTSRFAMSESSLADLLQKAASQYPNRAAYKFIDYDGSGWLHRNRDVVASPPASDDRGRGALDIRVKR